MATLAEQLSTEQVASLKGIGQTKQSRRRNQSHVVRRETAFERLTRPVENVVRVSPEQLKALNSIATAQEGRGRGWRRAQSQERVG